MGILLLVRIATKSYQLLKGYYNRNIFVIHFLNRFLFQSFLYPHHILLVNHFFILHFPQSRYFRCFVLVVFICCSDIFYLLFKFNSFSILIIITIIFYRFFIAIIFSILTNLKMISFFFFALPAKNTSFICFAWIIRTWKQSIQLKST